MTYLSDIKTLLKGDMVYFLQYWIVSAKLSENDDDLLGFEPGNFD
jgi:hypothetical protein